MPFLRSDSFRIKAGVTGVNPPPIKSWQSMSGGDLSAEDTKTRPGGIEPQRSLGGPTTRSDCTVTRLHGTGIHPYIVQWEQAINQSMWVSYTPLDANSNPQGATITLHGYLKSVTQSEMDADNAGKKTISLVMTCNADSTISQ